MSRALSSPVFATCSRTCVSLASASLMLVSSATAACAAGAPSMVERIDASTLEVVTREATTLASRRIAPPATRPPRASANVDGALRG
jgi:hypothetical protein